MNSKAKNTLGTSLAILSQGSDSQGGWVWDVIRAAVLLGGCLELLGFFFPSL